MSDLKRKASSEVNTSEEPDAKRPRSIQDQSAMNHEQIINSTAAWNLTEEVTVDDAGPNESVSAQDIQAHDAPAQVTPAQTTSTLHLEVHMPSQDVPAQAVETMNTEMRESKPSRTSVEPDSDKSARQRRIESMVDPGQNVRERGTVRNVDGDLRWVAANGTLVPCVYHNSIRAELIAEASQTGTLSYDVPRRHGNLDFNATDITAYHPEQQTWSEERSLWPRIRDNILNRLERKEYKELYAGQDPGKMMHNGRLVIDHDNHPVYMFPDLPATISSAVEGWWLEAITRLDSRIDRMDIRARLPAFRGKTDVKKESKMYGLSAIGNKRLRFREREGLIAWDSRNGSNLINQFFKSRLPAGCVERNTTEGGGPLSPGEVKKFQGIKKGNDGDADITEGPKQANKKSPSLDDAAGPLSARNFGYDGPAPELQTPPALTSTPRTGRQPQSRPPPFGAPGAHTPGFAPQINMDQPSSVGSSADILLPRGLSPAQVLGQYQFLSNMTGQIEKDFEAAIQAVRDEEDAFSTIRAGKNNGKEPIDRGTREENELNTSRKCSNMQSVNPANEHTDDAFSQSQNVQCPDDGNSSDKNIIDLRSPSPSTNVATPAAAAPGHPPAPKQQTTMHNTIGDEGWVPESEEIDEAFWEETMNKDWPSARGQGNDQRNLEVGRPGDNEAGEDTASQDIQAALFNALVPTSQVEGLGSSHGENHGCPDPLFKDLSGAEDNVEPAQPALQLEPIQPGSEHFHFSPDPQYDPFAPEDDELVPAQQPPQVEASRPSAEEIQSSSDPLFDGFFADLTPEAVQEMGASLGLSGDLADYRSPLDEQGPSLGQPAPAETATTGSKRKTMEGEPNNGSKKARLQQGPTSYTPYQPRQDHPRVPTQHSRRQDHKRLPPYVSSSPAPPLAQGSLPTPTATLEKSSTPNSATLMSPPPRRPLAAEPLQPPPYSNTQHYSSQAPPAKTPIAEPTSHKPQRHRNLPPYQTHRPPIPASLNVQPTPTPTHPNVPSPPSTTPRPASSQPRSNPAAQTDHRYTAPTTANQMALIITLLEPTIAQFQGLLRGTPFADHVVHTDMAASYMDQYQHIVRELEVLWRQMNWDRSALPRMRIVGPIDRARWEGR